MPTRVFSRQRGRSNPSKSPSETFRIFSSPSKDQMMPRNFCEDTYLQERRLDVNQEGKSVLMEKRRIPLDISEQVCQKSAPSGKNGRAQYIPVVSHPIVLTAKANLCHADQKSDEISKKKKTSVQAFRFLHH